MSIENVFIVSRWTKNNATLVGKSLAHKIIKQSLGTLNDGLKGPL